MDFFDACEKNAVSYTENGAKVFGTSGKKLVDLNFKVTSMRQDLDKMLFSLSMEEEPIYTLKWLLFLRDIRGGLGERKIFRELALALEQHDQQIAHTFFRYIPIEEYGRWDDIIYLAFESRDYNFSKKTLFNKITDQFREDIQNCVEGKPISLLAKWMPSINTSSRDSRIKAKVLAEWMGMTEKEYRKTLSRLRKHLDVVECKMSSNSWGDIKYENVPSRAGMLYIQAFKNHDGERYQKYLEDLKSGKTKAKAGTLYLHEITNRICRNRGDLDYLESAWKSIVTETETSLGDTLVVRDGSGSMYWEGYSDVRPKDVCDALTVFFAEKNTGAFKDKFITFSDKPEVVNLSCFKTLRDKLIALEDYGDIGSTNIESVFDMILSAIKNGAEPPKRVLIISDMQFNEAVQETEDRLFDVISKKFGEKALPKLIFWNLNPRSGNTVPMQENGNGLILLSGFSHKIMEQVISDEINPWGALKAQLDVPRYAVIDKYIGTANK